VVVEKHVYHHYPGRFRRVDGGYTIAAALMDQVLGIYVEVRGNP
jgi:hypothetical protein